MSINALNRGVPSLQSPMSPGVQGGGANPAARSGSSLAAAFARDTFQPAAASTPPAGATGPAGAAQGGGLEKVMGALEKVVQELTKVVDMLKQMLGGGKEGGPAGGGAPGGGGAAGGVPAGGGAGGAGGAAGGAEGAAAGGDGAGGAGGAGGAEGNAPAGGGDPSRGPTGEAPIDIARSVLGKNASELKVNGRLSEEMEDWVPNDVNCANFVSAVLQEAGQIDKGQHSASVANLRTNLEKDPQWQKTSIENAKPGDVVMMDTGNGDNSHVVIFAGMKDGKPTFIGSNNVNPDGSQKVVEGPMGSRITGVYTYTG